MEKKKLMNDILREAFDIGKTKTEGKS